MGKEKIMKTRLRKGKDFLKRISAGAAAALMAVVTVISNMEPIVAKADHIERWRICRISV